MKTSFKELMVKNGMTGEDTAKLLGLTRNTISVWANNENKIPNKWKPAIANLFKMELDELFEQNDFEKLPKATHSGKLKIGDLELDCYVLEDKTRVLSQGQMIKALGFKGSGVPKNGIRELPPFLAIKTLQPFVGNDLTSFANSKKFSLPQGGAANGYDGRLLSKVCDVYIDAEKAGALRANQKHIVDQCQILKSAFSEIGIIALIDEATGYEKDKKKKDLSELINKILEDIANPWKKMFADEFYIEIFRLKGWEFDYKTSKPRALAKMTIDIVYSRLEPMLYTELDKLNPILSNGKRANRLFQHLSENEGVQTLKHHLFKLTGMMEACKTWEQFYAILEDRHPKHPQTIEQMKKDPRYKDYNLDNLLER